jgi:hypothetical protein
VLELAQAEALVVSCLAQAEQLDALPPFDGAFACRVAPDELLLVAPASMHLELLGQVAGLLEESDPHALVLDQTPGWSVWSLAGPDVWRAFARLSAIPLPSTRPAFVQGTVAEVPGKAIVLADRLHIFVPSPLGHHLRARVLTACADLGPRETEPRALVLEAIPVEAPAVGGSRS